MSSSQCFLQPKVGVEGELMSKKTFPPKLSNSLFAHTWLFGLSQGTIFTQFKGTGDLYMHGFGGGMGDDLGWMT